MGLKHSKHHEKYHEKSISTDIIKTEDNIPVAKLSHKYSLDQHVIFFNRFKYAWSYGIIMRIKNENIYIVDYFTDQLYEFNKNSLAIKRSFEINDYDRHVNSTGKVNNNLVVSTINNMVVCTSNLYIHISLRCNSNKKYTENQIKIIENKPKIYYGQKVKIYLAYSTNDLMLSLVIHAYIKSIDATNIKVICYKYSEDRKYLSEIEISKKHVNYIVDAGDNQVIEMFSQVSTMINDKLVYGTVIDMYNEYVIISTHDEPIHISKCNLENIDYDDIKE